MFLVYDMQFSCPEVRHQAMSGAYAHITLVNLAKEPARLETAGLPDAAIAAILMHFKFCELGAVSPDYPYLCLDSDQHPWADHMHYEHVSQTLAVGAEAVLGLDGEAREKAFAWLLGYAAHVVTDMTIHPVVERKVGPYADNKTEHRICEMHQDAYIFQRLDLGDIGLAEHLTQGISDCCGPDDSNAPDPVITVVWLKMLKTAHPQAFVELAPDFEGWHQGFDLMVDKIAEEGNHLMPIARHVAAKFGLTYPSPDHLDWQYLEALDTPAGHQSYDQVFDSALANVLTFWKELADIVFNEIPDTVTKLATQEWNLDTGRNQGEAYVYWT